MRFGCLEIFERVLAEEEHCHAMQIASVWLHPTSSLHSTGTAGSVQMFYGINKDNPSAKE